MKMMMSRPYTTTGMSLRNNGQVDGYVKPGEPLRSPLPLPAKKERVRDDFPLQGKAEDEFDIAEVTQKDMEAFEKKATE